MNSVVNINPTELQSTPIAATERADIPDILRGFALLGIALANYEVLSYYMFLPPERATALPTAPVDRWLNYFSTMFLEGKFYSLFSLLFGMGFFVIMAKRKTSGNQLGIFYRRLFFLMLIGVAHSLLIWDGDILLFYGVVGMLLPLFRNVNNQTAVIIAGILLLSPLFFDTVKVLSDGRLNIANPVRDMAQEIDRELGITEENVTGWLLNNDTISDQLRWNKAGMAWSLYFRLDTNRIPKVLTMFLLGMCAGRIGLHLRLASFSPLLRYVRLIGFAVGIPAGIAMVLLREDELNLPHPAGLLDTLAYALNVTCLSLAYAATLCLLYLSPAAEKKLNILRPLGRMALTNYIMQSVCGVILFAPAFLAFGGSIGPAVYFPIVLVLFVLQIGYSHLWLRYFNYGPVEWIWRQLTYGRRLPLMRSVSGKVETTV